MITKEDLEIIEIEKFWDPILSNDTEIELDIDYINEAMREAKRQERKMNMNIFLDKFIGEVIADVVDEELKRAGF